jgi:hypothetical protein
MHITRQVAKTDATEKQLSGSEWQRIDPSDCHESEATEKQLAGNEWQRIESLGRFKVDASSVCLSPKA